MLAVCFVACSKSKPTDLRLFELKGDVKSVKTVLTYNVTSKGQKTRNSTRTEGIYCEFDEKGFLSICKKDEENLMYERDALGNIVSIRIPSEWQGDDLYSYTWNEEGFPIKEDVLPSEGVESFATLVFNDDSCSLASKIVYVSEESSYQWANHYEVLDRDSHGNWIKRIDVSNNKSGYQRYTLEERTITYYSDNKKSPSSDSQSYSTLSNNSTSNTSNQYDDSSTKWKEFAGTTYRASQFTSNRYQYYAFSYDRTGNGKYIIWWNYPRTNVVEDQMDFSIYKVESEGNYLYLYSYELNNPVKIQIQGSSLYTMTGDRYEIWN